MSAKHPYIPDGCDAQGRVLPTRTQRWIEAQDAQPAPAEARTEVGSDDGWEDAGWEPMVYVIVAFVALASAVWWAFNV